MWFGTLSSSEFRVMFVKARVVIVARTCSRYFGDDEKLLSCKDIKASS